MKPLFFIKLLVLSIIGAAVSSQLWADDQISRPIYCNNLNHEKQILECLENFATEQLKEGSHAEIKFSDSLQRHTDKYDIDLSAMQITPLSEYFKFYVDEESDLQGKSKGEKCFHFSNDQKTRNQQIQNIQNQIIEIADFLAQFHALSFGRQTSLIFPVKAVSLCGISEGNARPMSFKQRQIFFGMDINSKEIYTGDSLIDIWHTGSPIRLKNVIKFTKGARKLYYGKTKKIDALMRDEIAEKWYILNPIGNARVLAISIFLENFQGPLKKLTKPLKKLDENSPGLQEEVLSRMSSIAIGSGFSQPQREFLNSLQGDPKSIELYQEWLSKMGDVQSLASYTESNIFKQPELNQIVIMARDQSALFAAVANSHDISVQITHMAAQSLPLNHFEKIAESDKESQQDTIKINKTKFLGLYSTQNVEATVGQDRKVNINVDNQTTLGAAVNTVDIINVNLTIPRIKASFYKKASLFEVLETEL